MVREQQSFVGEVWESRSKRCNSEWSLELIALYISSGGGARAVIVEHFPECNR